MTRVTRAIGFTSPMSDTGACSCSRPTAVRRSWPERVARARPANAGNVYVGEKGTRVIRIDPKGAATLVATALVSGTLAVDAAGAVLISATYEIDRLRLDGMLVPVAGTGQPAQTTRPRCRPPRDP